MADRYSPERIAHLAEVLDEFHEIENRDLEWFVGTIGIWKADRLLFRPMNVPSYRRGYLFELTEDMRFTTVPFVRTDGSSAIALLLRNANEEAPDAPFGYEQLRLSTEGRLEYEHRNRGQNRFVRGRVDVAKSRLIMDALRSTSFPAPPQKSFLPGGSVLAIATNASPTGRVLVDYFDGLKMQGYGEVIRELSGLNTALRASDAAKLGGWAFVEARTR